MRALAALRVVHDVALPDALDEPDGGRPRRVDGGVELLGLEVVTAAEPGDAVVLLAEDPARPPAGT